MTTRVGSGSSESKSAEAAGREAVDRAVAGVGGRTPTLVLVFASSTHSLARVIDAARSRLPTDTPVIGCSTAGELTELGVTRNAVAALAIADEHISITAAFADNLNIAPDKAIASLLSGVGRNPQRKENLTIALVDTLTGQGEAIIDALHAKLGVLHQIVGAAAGDDGKMERAYVAAGQQVASNAAALLHVATAAPWAVGVDHGFTAATQMMRVTRSVGTHVYELDGVPIYEVYREFAQRRGVSLESANASAFLVNNELGLYFFEQFKRARAPLKILPDKGFACAAPVPEGSTVAILKSDEASLLSAARAAAQEAKERLRGREAAGVIVFDCVCRATILGDAFPKELTAIRSVFPNVPLAGFLSYGEIARYSGKLDGWHNASVVVVAIPA